MTDTNKSLTRQEIIAKVAAGESLTGADLTGAVLRRADLTDADLTGADLTGADLTDAVLTGADLTDARLPTGEIWEEYLHEVVPALCTAGGVPLVEVAEHFDCHTWTNCPMAAAFRTNRIDGVPILLRPRADQFIRFFDANLIEVVRGEDGAITFSSPVKVEIKR